MGRRKSGAERREVRKKRECKKEGEGYRKKRKGQGGLLPEREGREDYCLGERVGRTTTWGRV